MRVMMAMEGETTEGGAEEARDRSMRDAQR